MGFTSNLLRGQIYDYFDLLYSLFRIVEKHVHWAVLTFLLLWGPLSKENSISLDPKF